jgi:hypothetical protein
MRVRLARSKQTIIGKPAPCLGFVARQLIAEHVNPTADDLAVDALLGHPCKPRRHIRQRFGHRARRFAAGKCKGNASAIFNLPDARKPRRIVADRGQQLRWHQMGMAIDDHSFPL